MAKHPPSIRDPFEVVGKIPKGKAYQWIAITVLGSGDFPQPVPFEGWKPVPARRHPKMPRNRKGQIVYGGQLLVERSEAEVRKAKKRELEFAQALANQAKPESFSGHLHGSVWTLVDPVSSPFDTSTIRAEIEESGGTVPVEVRIKLSEREIDAAATCGLTAREYVRRKSMMMAEIGLAALIHHEAGVFEFGELVVKKETP